MGLLNAMLAILGHWNVDSNDKLMEDGRGTKFGVIGVYRVLFAWKRLLLLPSAGVFVRFCTDKALL